MAEPQKYRKFSSDELPDADGQTREQPPPLPPRGPAVYRKPPPPPQIPPPPPQIPPPPPIPTRKYSRSVSYQPVEEAKQTVEIQISSDGKPTGARPKDKPPHRSFSFADHVPKNKVEDSTSVPKTSTSPSMPPAYREVPERAKVSLNPAGRSSPATPSSQSLSPQADEDAPKKGFMRNWFSKAKDFMTKKTYEPLEQDQVPEDNVKPPSKKMDKSKKYYKLDEDPSPQKPVKTRTYRRPVPQPSFTKVPDTASGPRSEIEDSGEKAASGSGSEDLMDLTYAVPAPQPETFHHQSQISDRESDFASSSDFESSTESQASGSVRVVQTTESDGSVRVVKTSTETGQTTSFTLRPELCRIKVNAPADIRVAYSYSGAFTTCISYETATPLPTATSQATTATSQATTATSDARSNVTEAEAKTDKK